MVKKRAKAPRWTWTYAQETVSLPQSEVRGCRAVGSATCRGAGLEDIGVKHLVLQHYVLLHPVLLYLVPLGLVLLRPVLLCLVLLCHLLPSLPVGRLSLLPPTPGHEHTLRGQNRRVPTQGSKNWCSRCPCLLISGSLTRKYDCLLTWGAASQTVASKAEGGHAVCLIAPLTFLLTHITVLSSWS